MKKKILGSIIIILCIFFVALIIIFVKYNNKNDKDPFKSLRLEESKNCESEYKYRFDITIDSSEEFIDFLKDNQKQFVDKYGNSWLRLDNFKDNITGEIKWEEIIKNVHTITINDIDIYQLTYYPIYCKNGFVLQISSNGYMLLNKCCGM